MKIVVVYGQNNKGNTYAFAQRLLGMLKKEENTVEEFFPKDFVREFCTGCTNCFFKGENTCPHAESVQPVLRAIDSADLLVFASACYVLDVTAQMKNLLDHLGYRFANHRPAEAMFSKQAVVLATAAGAGMKKTVKTMQDSLFFWGVPHIYSYGLRVSALQYNDIPQKRRDKIEKKLARIAQKVEKGACRRASIKTRGLFWVMKKMQQGNNWGPLDKSYWQQKGWLTGQSPF